MPGNTKVEQASERDRQTHPLQHMRPLTAPQTGDDHRGLDRTEEYERTGFCTQTEVGKGKRDRVQEGLKPREPAAGAENMTVPQKTRRAPRM